MVASGGRAPMTAGITGFLRGRPRPRFAGGAAESEGGMTDAEADCAAILGLGGFLPRAGAGRGGRVLIEGFGFFNCAAVFFFFLPIRPAVPRGGAVFRWDFLRWGMDVLRKWEDSGSVPSDPIEYSAIPFAGQGVASSALEYPSSWREPVPAGGPVAFVL